MTRFEHLTGRSHHLFDRGVRRFRSPLWFLRADTHPTPLNPAGPSSQGSAQAGSDVTSDTDRPEDWRI